jgi:hypothetical protein
MAKKKKEVCPYCGKAFAYLSRHKCKIKEKVEGPADERSTVERRIERIEEKKKDLKRGLKKDEKGILNIINKERDILFDDLLNLVDKDRNGLEYVLDVLVLQSKIKMNRELVEAAWTKHIFAIEDYKEEIKVIDVSINKDKKDFIWNIFSRQPCFICPYSEAKCNETNQLPNQLNPYHCPMLTDWIEKAMENIEYNIKFADIKEETLG